MKQIWITRAGTPDVLQVKEAPDPKPEAGEVLISVEAAGINFADLMARMGIYPDAPPIPMVVGYEIAGTIEAVGDGISSDRIGEPVVALCRFNGYSSKVVVPSIQAVKRPDNLDAVTAAGIPVVGLTAWMMLEDMGRVREGDRVLVHSAGGGVGLAALDLLKWRGAYAIGTASKGKHEMLYDLGYDQLIDYRNQDFEEVLSGEPGLDLILDAVGGDSWAKGMRLLASGGRMICFGLSSQTQTNKSSMWKSLKAVTQIPWLKFNPVNLMNTNTGVMGVNLGKLWHENERIAKSLASLLDLWEKGILRPRIDTTFSFEEAAAAHQYIHDRKNLGKVILVP